MHRQFNTKDWPTTSSTYYLPANKWSYQQTPTRRLLALPVAPNKVRFPVPTLGTQFSPNYLHSSPTAHSCQPTAQIHSPTLTLHSHISSAIQKLHSTTENSLKLTGLPGLINWTAEASCTRVTGWVWLSGFKGQRKQAKGWCSQPIRTKALGCNRARSLARAKNQGNTRHSTAAHS